MPVNYQTPDPDSLRPVSGIRLGVAKANICKPAHDDLTLISLDPDCHVSGVFTKNRFCAAPVQICKQHLATGQEIRALVVNTGIANAGTGEIGLEAARQTCASVAQLLKIDTQMVLPFSTGVILEHLPVERIITSLPEAYNDLNPRHWYQAAHAIMTTDTVAKASSRTLDIAGNTINITGISKGSGMIRPNMATMLGFLATDAGIAPNLLQKLTQEITDHSFNCISVDGDTSTNDAFIVIATGHSNAAFNTENSPGYQQLKAALIDIALELAQAIVRDGEGATKFISIIVEQGSSTSECRQVAYAIAESSLVKTACFASDPNLGRILAAIGNSGIHDLEVNAIQVWLESNSEHQLVAQNGARADSYCEAEAIEIMAQPEITIRIKLNRGNAEAKIYTCDLSYDYVKINAEYRS